MESFFATLKTELIYRQQLKTQEEVKTRIFEYIEMFYNRERRHSSLGLKIQLISNGRLPYLNYVSFFLGEDHV